ncbi:MAG: hypothetical protein E7341_05600, partial [Clostridiales bacterium]|nr:hypothetical protein [Clostridiales bacterium]
MKKFAKSLKRILVTCLSFLFVAVAFVGCGEKPGDDTPGVTPPPADTSYQEFLLAQEKFSSALFSAGKEEVNYSQVPAFYLTDETVAFDATSDKLTYARDGEVVVTNLAGSDEFYINNGENTINVIPDAYNGEEEVENLGKYNVLAINNGFVLSTYTVGTEKHYSVIDYSVFGDVAEIYSSKVESAQSEVKLYANFIVEEQGTGLEVYPLEGRVFDADNSIQTTTLKKLTLDDNVFAYKNDTLLIVNYFNSLDNSLETLSFELGSNPYSIFRIGVDKYLIEKATVSTVASETAYKIAENHFETYSYQVLNISKDAETAVSDYALTEGYTAVMSQEILKFVDEYSYVYEFKVNENNALDYNGVVKYFDENMNTVVAYESKIYGQGANPKIVYGNDCRYIASNKIFSVDKNLAVTEVYNIEQNGYKVKGGYFAGNNFLVTKNGSYFLMNMNGQIALSLEDYEISKLVAFDGSRLMFATNSAYYVVDVAGASVQELPIAQGETVITDTLLEIAFETENSCLYYTRNEQGLYNFYNLESETPVYANIESIEIKQNNSADSNLNDIFVVKLVDNDENTFVFTINNYSNADEVEPYAYYCEASEGEVDNYASIVEGSTSTATLYYDSEEIGSATITGLDYIITMEQGWYLDEYTFTLVIQNTPYTWTIKNTSFSGVTPSATLVETTSSGYGSLSVKLNDSSNVVYTVTLKKNNAQINTAYNNNQTVEEATQRKQEIYFIVAKYLDGCNNFLTTFAGTNYEVLTVKKFVANTEETMAQVVLPDTIYAKDGHAVKWFYANNPTTLPTGMSYSSMNYAGSAIDSSTHTFGVTSNRKTYVVAQYVKEVNTLLVEPDIGTYHANALTGNMTIEIVNPTAPKGYTFVGWKFEYCSATYAPYYTGNNTISYKATMGATVVEQDDLEGVTTFEVRGTFNKVVVTNIVLHGGTAKVTALYTANEYTLNYYVVDSFTEGTTDTTYKHINIRADYKLLSSVKVTFDQNYTVAAIPALPTGTSFLHWTFETEDASYSFNIDAGAVYTPWEFDTNYNIYAYYARNIYTIYYHEISIDSPYHAYAYINDISKYTEVRRTTVTYGDNFSFGSTLFPVPDGTAFASWKLFNGIQSTGTVDNTGSHNDGTDLFVWHYTTNLYVYEYYLPKTYTIHYYELKEPANSAATSYYDVSYINLGYYYEEAKTDYAIFGGQYTVSGITVTAPHGTTFAGWNFRREKVPSTSITVTPGVNQGQKFAWSYDYDVYYYACYTINTYTISYNFNNGTPGESIDSSFVEYKTGVVPANPVDGVKYTISYNETVYVPNPTRVGYNFMGWILENTSEDADLHESGITSALIPFLSTTVNGVKTYYYQDGLGTVLTTIKHSYYSRLNENGGQNVRFVAVWAAIGYNLVYELEGGSASAVYPTSTSYDTYINLPYPTKFCNNFDGWSFYTQKDEKRFYFDENNMATSYVNLTTIENETIYVEANWIPYSYTVV